VTNTVTIAGGGIGGLTAALCLHAAGFDVDVFESVAEPGELGVGINVLPHSVRVLDNLGLLVDMDRIAVRTSRLMFLSNDGKQIWSEQRGLDAGNPWPQFSVHRGRLHRLLWQTALDRLGPERIHAGHRLVSVDGADEVAVQATGVFLDRASGNNVSVRSDVLVGADGIHSAVRQQFYPDQGLPRPSGLVLWRGAVEAEPYLDGTTMFMAGDDQQKVVVYPIGSPNADGKVLTNWVAERPLDVDMATVSWNRETDVDSVAAHFSDWDFDWIDVGKLISSTSAAYEFPMVDRDPIERWSFGRTTMLGDAAHPMRPNGSNGSSQAILDGEALANAMTDHEDLRDALRAYQADRLEPTARLTYANRQAGPERVMQWIRERCDGSCGDHHTCIDPDELERAANAYKQLAGFDLAHLRSLSGND
jgi:2-polyprenyl-6-methoxyphenol hydroxylase-like FAD-dependent oxidoreductase